MRWGSQAARVVFTVVAVGVLIWATVQQWPAVVDAAQRLAGRDLAVSLGYALVGLLFQLLSWRSLLNATGGRVGLEASGRVYFVGQLGKYVPGMVWAIVGQAELARRHGVSRARTSLVAIAALVVLTVTGAAGGIALTVVFSGGVATELIWQAAAVVVVGGVALTPPIFNRLLAVAGRVARRPGTVEPVPGQALAASSGWAFAMWVAFGAHAAVLVAPLVSDRADLGELLQAAGAYCIAWVVGFVVVIAPAGAGAREGTLVALLAPLIGPSDALVVAVVSRGLMLAADGLAAALSALPWGFRAHGVVREGPAKRDAGGPEQAPGSEPTRTSTS